MFGDVIDRGCGNLVKILNLGKIAMHESSTVPEHLIAVSTKCSSVHTILTMHGGLVLYAIIASAHMLGSCIAIVVTQTPGLGYYSTFRDIPTLGAGGETVEPLRVILRCGWVRTMRNDVVV
eukprot:COSAG02_NODE_1941_length_10311_cov_5.935272_2_plen_121_part_00